MKQSQQGLILITVLIFLLVLALLSLAALDNSQLQVRMSYNLKDYTQSLQAAEAGLLAAEKQLSAATKPSCLINCPIKFANTSIKYSIEPLASKSCRDIYRITAWVSESYPITVQSIYAVAIKDPACEKTPLAVGRLVWRELD
jgi:type IV pilus assembly protein PilX